MTEENSTPVAAKKTGAQKVEMVANVAIIVAAVAIVFFFIRNQFIKTQPEAPPTIATGARVPLKDVNWQASPKSVVLVVSTQCHFCTESAPFYRQLVSQCKQQHVRTIAVLPQAVPEGQSYLKNEGVEVDEVRQFPLSDIPAGGTPTLLLVDGSGTVRNVWIGKLQDTEEKEVLSKVGS